MPADPAEVARAAAAEAYVAHRPLEIHIGAEDALRRLDVVSSFGWHYVPYERTYRRLPVIGGDFAIVVNPEGQVSSVSVAQQYTVEDLNTTPALTSAEAQAIASGLVRSVSEIDEGSLVV